MNNVEVNQDLLAGYLLAYPDNITYWIKDALREHPVWMRFSDYQISAQQNGTKILPAEHITALMKVEGDLDGIKRVAACAALWRDAVDNDPSLTLDWRQAQWVAQQTGRPAPEHPDLDTVADDLKEYAEGVYERLRRHVAKALDVRLSKLDEAVERARKPFLGDPPGRNSNAGGREPNPHASDIPLKCSEKGTPRPIVYNAIQILELDERWRGVLAWDEFAQKPTLRRRPPFLQEHISWGEREICDADDTEIAAWIQQHYDVNIPSSVAYEAVFAVASRHPYHPVRDYLDSLTWDGEPRIDMWLIDLFGCEGTAYVKAVSSKTLIAAVARIYRPGCKHDCATILESEQGINKSSAWRIMASDKWFTDGMPDMHSKDAMQHLAGKWIVEMAELSSLARSDVEASKRFLSATQDHYRPSYGRHTKTVLRQCIFVGTTNATTYLKDTTGNRRFWPIACYQEGDLEVLTAMRDQLWAEATHRFKSGEPVELPRSLWADAGEVQESRVEIDAWEQPITEWLSGFDPSVDKVAASDVFVFALSIEDMNQWSNVSSKRIAGIMRKLGWVHQGIRMNGKKCNGYRKIRPGEIVRHRVKSMPTTVKGVPGTPPDCTG